MERPPQRKRLRTSRPRLSVPSGTELEGCAYGAPAKSVGECGAKNGPMSASATSSTTRRTPIFVRVWPQARRMRTTAGRLTDGAVMGAVGAIAVIAATSAAAD